MPLFLYWLIHGDYDRYVWLINGPAPFDQFGGGPFQLFMGVGFLALGAGMVTAGTSLRLAPTRPQIAVVAAFGAMTALAVGLFLLAVTLGG
jgi:hypothetical protein